MTRYLVTWSIDIFEAENETDAAIQARNIQLNPDTIATVFEVQEVNDETEEVSSTVSIVDLMGEWEDGE